MQIGERIIVIQVYKNWYTSLNFTIITKYNDYYAYSLRIYYLDRIRKLLGYHLLNIFSLERLLFWR